MRHPPPSISENGQISAHAPGEPGGSWPCPPVRDARERTGTEEVFDGFGAGISDKRGVHRKSPQEGGGQEQTTAVRHRAFAEASRIDRPHTAAELRRVAGRDDEEQARRADAALDHDRTPPQQALESMICSVPAHQYLK